MAAEIAVLVSTAKAVTELLEKAKPLVGQIRSGFRAQNDSVQQDLAKKFEELEASIHAVGDLAYVGEEYGRMHEEVRGLLWDCERARSFLVENREECIAILDEEFAKHTLAEWKVKLDTMEGVWAPMQSQLELHDDFEAYTTFTPNEAVERKADEILDQVVAWGRALRSLRVPA